MWCSGVRRGFHSIGICGLPNVGKSTLWNAVTKTQNAQAANFPFCTIEPNKASVAIPDQRLVTLAQLVGSQKRIPSLLEMVDVAGLIRGAHEGKGLGNQFLDDLRGVDALVHVIRCFKDSKIVHVENDGLSLDPVEDRAIIRSELLLADMQLLERRKENLSSKHNAKKGGSDKQLVSRAIELSCGLLEQEMEVTEARVRQLVSGEEFKMIWPMIASFGLLSSKPVIHVANVDEASAVDGNDLSRALEEQLKQEGCNVESEFVLVSAALEEMAATCETEELQKSFLEEYGLERTGLDAIVESCSRALNVHVFYTVGPKEARSWLIPQNASAVVAAGKIHSDFAEGFISAEVIHYQDYLNCKGEAGARKLGKQMIKGRDYVVHDGDVMHFRTTKKRD